MQIPVGRCESASTYITSQYWAPLPRRRTGYDRLRVSDVFSGTVLVTTMHDNPGLYRCVVGIRSDVFSASFELIGTFRNFHGNINKILKNIISVTACVAHSIIINRVPEIIQPFQSWAIMDVYI